MSVITTDFKDTPYWWEAAPPINGTIDTPEARYDAVIVGSGVTGLNAALTLAEAGRKVLLVDSGKIGSGASTRNNGAVVPFGFLHQEQLERQFGAELGPQVARVAVDSFEYLLDMPKRYDFDPMLKSYERYFLACTPGHYQHYVEDAKLEAERGLGLGWVPIEKAELERRTGIRGFHGGLHIKSSMAMHSGLYVQGVVRAAERAGVALLGNCRVKKITRSGSGFTIATERGDVRATNVVMATNGYSDSAVPFLKSRIVPARLYLSATEPVAPEIMQRIFPDRQFANSKRSMGWIRPSPDGTRLMVGGRGGMRGNDPVAHATKLHQDMVAMIPELAHLKLSHCWYGMIGFPMDFTPHLGEADGLHYAAGYSGVGMCYGTYLGHRLAKKILGAPPSESATALDKLPFRKVPGPSFLNPLYSRMGIEWYNLRDRWDLRDA